MAWLGALTLGWSLGSAPTALGAVTAVNLTSGGTDASQSSYTTASITPSAGKLILLAVDHMGPQGNAGSVTVSASGNGLTWVQVTNIIFNSSNFGLTLFRAMGSSPSTGTITLSCSGNNPSRMNWSVTEFG